jgi:hypothetical protein
MPQTPPPEVDVLPEAPSSQNPIPFAGIMDTFLAALGPFRAGMIAQAANCYSNAMDGYNNAQLALSSAISAAASAAAASATAGVTKWISGSSYIEGDDVTWSPINYLSYRRKTTGAGTLDPSADATNWAPTSAAPGANHDITSLDDITINGSSVPLIVNSTTSSGTKIELQDAGVPIGFLGGTNSLPFAVFSSESIELLHVDASGNVAPKGKVDLSGASSGLSDPLSVENGGTGAGTVAEAREALGIIPSGTRMIFQQTSAPTGWTKDIATAMNNAAIRLTTGTVGVGGTVPFSTFVAQSVGSTTLSIEQIPSHRHVETMANGDTAWSQAGGGISGSIANNSSGNGSVTLDTGETGSGGAHTHALNMDLVYVDFIVATKD